MCTGTLSDLVGRREEVARGSVSFPLMVSLSNGSVSFPLMVSLSNHEPFGRSSFD
jgi:hypothetical protein